MAAIMIPSTMKAIPPVSIVVVSPVLTTRAVVSPVIRRRIREGFHRDAWNAKPDTDVRMSFGRDTLGDTCDPESGS